MIIEKTLNLSIKEQLNLALESNNLDILKELVESPVMTVRRALSKNRNINKTIANTLAFDPVLNVCYMAIKNPNCTIERSFSTSCLTSCVTCNNDEREIDCKNCESKRKFR